jgi:hypothetical protein
MPSVAVPGSSPMQVLSARGRERCSLDFSIFELFISQPRISGGRDSTTQAPSPADNPGS